MPLPVIDRWGPGGRVLTLIVSPHAKQGFVDHTFYDAPSVRKHGARWRLPPLSRRDAMANDLTNAFDL